MTENQQNTVRGTTVDDFIKNFPFPMIREKQSFVLKEIDAAFASGYRHIILEAPTGFGKSPVAIGIALTLGTGHICTSTKDLQMQYARDFPFVKVAKGKNNFICTVKDDLIRNGTHKCGSSCKCRLRTMYVSFKNDGCKYRTFPKDYKIENKGTIDEKVFIDCRSEEVYRDKHSQWSHARNLKEELRVWRPCEYFHQLNIALAASHSVFNYSMLLALLTKKGLPPRELLVLDEAHLLETEIVRFMGISISKRRWKKYIPNFKIADYGYDDIEKWVDFLIELEIRMFDLTRNMSGELAVEAVTDIEKLGQVIYSIRSNPIIVSEIKKEDYEVVSVEFKPLDVSLYCREVFETCNRTLMMSATILDKDAFCTSVGLTTKEVKFIQVPSDFPLQNRPIIPLNIAYLNSDSLKLQEVQIKIAMAINNLMTSHRNDKGIIHTTSYKQLDFIRQNISQENKCRLLGTDPEIQRDDVIVEHINSTKPTVLISPSLDPLRNY